MTQAMKKSCRQQKYLPSPGGGRGERVDGKAGGFWE